MTVTRKHGIYAITIGATTLGGITRQNIATGTEVRGEPSSGEVWARFQALYAQKIAPGFTTQAIATALAAVGATGWSLASHGSGLALYAQKHADGSTRASGSSHRKYQFTKGILAPRTLDVDHRGDATLTFEAVIAYDGSNDPLAITDAAAIPSITSDAERFTLGPVAIGGISLPEVRRFSIDFGLDVVSEGADSDVWDTFASVRTQQTVLTLRGIDVEWLKAANIPLIGKAGTHANTTIYLRQRAQGSTFVANGTAEHIKFTADGLAWIDQAFDAGENDAAETALTMRLRYDGTNAPLTTNTASAIT